MFITKKNVQPTLTHILSHYEVNLICTFECLVKDVFYLFITSNHQLWLKTQLIITLLINKLCDRNDNL